MNLLENETFKRFFFSGIYDKEEVKEGIIYFSSKVVYNKHGNDNLYNISNEVLKKEIIDEAMPKYKQFYRFVTLNDQYKKCGFDVDTEQIKQELEEKINILIENQKMIDTAAGIFILKGEAQRLDSKPYYVYGKGIQGEEAWTKQIYRILEILEQLEQRDMLEYYECWIYTKLQRAILRDNPEEMPYMQKAYQLFEERKQKILAKKEKEEFIL